MTDQFILNDVYLSSKYIKENDLYPKYNRISIIGHNALSDTLYKTIEYISKNNDKRKYDLSFFDNSIELTVSDNTTYIYFLNCDKEINTNSVKRILTKIKDLKNTNFILVTKLPRLPFIDFSNNISEMELSVILESSILTDIVTTVKEFSNYVDIREIRIDNLFGYMIEDDGKTKITSLCNEVNENSTITIFRDDIYKEYGAITVVDAINAIFTVIKNGKPFNTYNATSFVLSDLYIKEYLFSLVSPFDVKLIFDSEEGKLNKKHFSTLSCGKLEAIGFKSATNIDDSLRFAFLSKLDKKYDIQSVFYNNEYDGKLDRIKNIELKVLKEVDKICRDNNIKYFLSGGSMLGAVRHKGMIPWDDDIDIAMLREDYKKFKEICKDNLSEEFKYQTFENKDGYHFFFDKITNKNTYYATKYSDEFDMLKGVSLDIFVFDKTAETSFKQKLHYKRLMLIRRMMNVRWKNRARKGKMYILSKMLLPILRLRSMDSYSKSYDKVVRAYENNDSSFVLPPATDEKYVGSMPLDWFSEVKEIEFEGIKTFIPVGYDNYLKLWYGEDYMKLLPLCEQKSSHDYYRLDLGTDLNKESKLDFSENGELK